MQEPESSYAIILYLSFGFGVVNYLSVILSTEYQGVSLLLGTIQLFLHLAARSVIRSMRRLDKNKMTYRQYLARTLDKPLPKEWMR